MQYHKARLLVGEDKDAPVVGLCLHYNLTIPFAVNGSGKSLFRPLHRGLLLEGDHLATYL